MIHWKDAGIDYPEAMRERWRKQVCAWEIEKDGSCMGVGCGDDDEPHEICQACDRHEFGWEETR